jgi:hypothetical protein
MASKNKKFIRKTVLQEKLKYITIFTALMMLLTVPIAQCAFFDNAGKSARAMGMGEVFLASSTDALGYGYNPAGLYKFKTKQLGLGYSKPIAFVSDLSSSQINYVMPLSGTSGLGLGFSYTGIDVASDMVISGGYGISLSEKFALGANAKIMRWSTDSEKVLYGTGNDAGLSKTSFSLDLSAMYSFGQAFGLDNLSTGIYVKDALMPNISESGDDGGKLPVEVGIGLMTQKNGITIAGDAAIADGVTFLKAGAESGITGSNLKIRAGFIYGSDFKDELEKADVDFGLGYTFSSLIFDYAYNLPIALTNSGGKHFVSFGFSF